MLSILIFPDLISSVVFPVMSSCSNKCLYLILSSIALNFSFVLTFSIFCKTSILFSCGINFNSVSSSTIFLSSTLSFGLSSFSFLAIFSNTSLKRGSMLTSCSNIPFIKGLSFVFNDSNSFKGLLQLANAFIIGFPVDDNFSINFSINFFKISSCSSSSDSNLSASSSFSPASSSSSFSPASSSSSSSFSPDSSFPDSSS